MMKNETTVIVGETGSGKTTQIPQYLLSGAVRHRHDAAPNEPPLRIAVTQPRRVAAISLATRVAEEMGYNLGSRVGYSVRFDDRSSPNTRLKFVTDGTLLQELLGDRLLSGYDIIILDEAHERSLRTDMLMGFLKLIQKRRREMVEAKEAYPIDAERASVPVRPLKIVVMSATLDAKRFTDFFGSSVMFIRILLAGDIDRITCSHSAVRRYTCKADSTTYRYFTRTKLSRITSKPPSRLAYRYMRFSLLETCSSSSRVRWQLTL